MNANYKKLYGILTLTSYTTWLIFVNDHLLIVNTFFKHKTAQTRLHEAIIGLMRVHPRRMHVVITTNSQLPITQSLFLLRLRNYKLQY